MGRWQPDSRGRLQEAALALYSERGFDQTTAAQIAARAGLTERTFFRHFADKREVLFGGSALLQERIVAGVAGAPGADGPLDAVSWGLDAAAAMLGEFRRDLSRQRQAVIAANPELRERELAKLDDYAAAVAAALRQRGVSEPQATLAAEAGMTVLRVAIQRWASGDDEPRPRRHHARLRRRAAGGSDRRLSPPETMRQFVVMAKPVGPVCNLACPYCYYLGKRDLFPADEHYQMTDEVLEAFVASFTQASPGPVVHFVWHGGEPTLAGVAFYRRAVELQRRYLPDGWSCLNSLQTNGTLLDQKWCAFLAEERFAVGISIDGPGALHDTSRRGPPRSPHPRSLHAGVPCAAGAWGRPRRALHGK